MKVYGVYGGYYDDCHLVALFSTKEKAQEFISNVDIVDNHDREKFDTSWLYNNNHSQYVTYKSISELHIEPVEYELDSLDNIIKENKNIYHGFISDSGNVVFMDRRMDHYFEYGAVMSFNNTFKHETALVYVDGYYKLLDDTEVPFEYIRKDYSNVIDDENATSKQYEDCPIIEHEYIPGVHFCVEAHSKEEAIEIVKNWSK